MLTSYHVVLTEKYRSLLENRWFWMVFALLVLGSLMAYAFYCTSRGYDFNGNIKLNWPKVWEMGIGCKAR
ncbi:MULTISPECIES: hypothetical protein [Bacillus]|uniref:Uncharacterized protein n=1 Tax=Bacillus cereus TaxID=1396 RepID=A0A9X6UIH2_BACCE|nr:MULTISPECIES: hypothetical protein [Bacillus]MED1899998.1 hypothetical protein [Bacillus thuringiensis]MED2040224.1 hypothetical protein [Bacillus wiedmannii]PEQ83502.1 hypothetical protein CN475_23235 [Bacillus cereus]PFN46306.1 hypothetical protein COJ56_00510 [Bacillus thuringiensis]RFB51735.1 hypothetical protein DZB90_30265 [Bacillus thuringiensis]